MTDDRHIPFYDVLSTVSNDYSTNASNNSDSTSIPIYTDTKSVARLGFDWIGLLGLDLSFYRNDLNRTLFCWLCRDRSENLSELELNEQWVSACICEGVREYAHQKCLLTYIINNKYYNPQWEIKCSWCNAPYLITVDGPSILYRIQTYFDSMLRLFVPALVSTGTLLSVATLSYGYGDMLLRFIHGREEFFELFDDIFFSNNCLMAEFHLMMIPISLIYFESYNWEHFFATKIIQRVLTDRSIQGQNWLMMNDIFNQDTTSLNVSNNRNHLTSTNETLISQNNQPIMLEIGNTGEPSSTSLHVDISNLDVYPREKRNVVGFVVTGLAIPFLSYWLASILFPRVNHNLLRTYLGWTCIQGIRGAFRIAYQLHAVKVVTSIKIFNRNRSALSPFRLQ